MNGPAQAGLRLRTEKVDWAGSGRLPLQHPKRAVVSGTEAARADLSLKSLTTFVYELDLTS